MQNPNSTPIKLAICDDHQVVLQGLSMILSEELGFQVVGLFQNGTQLKHFLKLSPNAVDYVVIDAQLQAENGFDIATAILESSPCKIILFSSFVDSYMILKAKKIGFYACISKEIQSQDFISLLKYPSSEFVSFPDIRLLTNVNKVEEIISAFSLLTKREIEVVKILVNGKSSRDSADELNISTYTLETHKKNIFRKLEINSIGELIHLAHEFKLVP